MKYPQASHFLFFIFIMMATVLGYANGAKFSINIRDQGSLRRGAQVFMNYCSGCHALRYMRYQQMAQDLGWGDNAGNIAPTFLMNNLILTTANKEDPVEIAMPPTDARQWFGKVPPDLSLTARQRSATWIYTYLKSFYIDKTRPFGTNNLLIPDVAMPNALETLQGLVVAKHGAGANASMPDLLIVKPGTMNEEQFDKTLEDLVTFLVYVAEPAKLVRYRIGVGVIIFLCCFIGVFYTLMLSQHEK